MLPMAVAWSCWGDIAICYELPVMRMRSCLRIVATPKAYDSSDLSETTPGTKSDVIACFEFYCTALDKQHVFEHSWRAQFHAVV